MKIKGVDWSYFDKFDEITDKYLPDEGEENTMATQIVTAISKLVYMWYNNGDVFDNTRNLNGCFNNISTYANWIYDYIDGASRILNKVYSCLSGADYEYLLKELADTYLKEEYLEDLSKKEKTDSIYDCEDGKYMFIDEYDDEYYEEQYYDDED
jgi:uncharacterized UBP type Zn finger protein